MVRPTPSQSTTPNTYDPSAQPENIATHVTISITGNRNTPMIDNIKTKPNPASAEVIRKPDQIARPGCANANSRQLA